MYNKKTKRHQLGAFHFAMSAQAGCIDAQWWAMFSNFAAL